MSLPVQPFLRQEKDGAVVIDLHVMPNAAQTRVQGLHDGALRLRLQAPPVDGKANQALLAWLAQELGLGRAALELVRGASARRKQVRVAPAYAARACWDALVRAAGG